MSIKTSGFKDFFDNLKTLGEDIDSIAESMLEAGAEVTVAEWKKGIQEERHKIVNRHGKGYIEKNGYIDTGDMEKSVDSSILKSGRSAEIYPRGKDRKGVRNATKAYVLHYGKSSMPGSRFVDKIEDKAAPEVYEAMDNIMDEYLKKHGL